MIFFLLLNFIIDEEVGDSYLDASKSDVEISVENFN